MSGKQMAFRCGKCQYEWEGEKIGIVTCPKCGNKSLIGMKVKIQ